MLTAIRRSSTNLLVSPEKRKKEKLAQQQQKDSGGAGTDNKAGSAPKSPSLIKESPSSHVSGQRTFLAMEKSPLDNDKPRVIEFFDDGVFIHIPYDEAVKVDVVTLPDEAPSSTIHTPSLSMSPTRSLSLSSPSSRSLVESGRWKLREAILITSIRSVVALPDNDTVTFQWHRPIHTPSLPAKKSPDEPQQTETDVKQDLVLTTFETKSCVDIEYLFSHIINQHLAMTRSGDLELLPRRVISPPCEFIQRELLHPETFVKSFAFCEDADESLPGAKQVAGW